MPLRLTGMNSGLDTESIIQDLVRAKSGNVNKAKKKQTSLQWKQEAWKDLNTKLLKLYNGVIGNMRWQTTYMKKMTVAANKNAVDIITGPDAVNGVQNLKINKLAKTGYLTGAQLSEDGSITAATKLNELNPGGFSAGEAGTISITTGGKTTDINVNGDTTISDVLTQLKNAGVNANFDVKSQRFFISAKESGVKNDFSITASDGIGQRALESMGISTSLALDEANMARYREYAAYYAAGDRTQTLANMSALTGQTIADRAAAYHADNEEIIKNLEDYHFKIDALKGNDKYQEGVTTAELDDAIKAKNEEITALQAEIKDMEDGEEKAAKEEQLKALVQEAGELSVSHGLAKEVEGYETKIQELTDRKAVNDSYVDAAGNPTAKLTEEVEDNYFAKAEYAAQVVSQYEAGTLPTGGATKISAQNAEITLNGATFTSNTNVFEINGLTFTALQETAEEFTVTTQNDTSGIYDTIKNFLKEYNAIMNEMDKLYNADAAKGYEPLTDDEKDTMSDKDIEKWEEKVKDAILRRDENLGKVSEGMRSVMSAGIEVNGRTMYLSDFGIDLLGYFEAADNEKHAYHIFGDPDDELTSGKDDKLKSMIAADPDTITAFFSTLSKNLYAKMGELSGRSDYSSYNTFYDDKKMKEDYSSYTAKIAQLEAKLAAYEDKYYKKFGAMETALARLQSNQNAILGLFGGSQ